MEKDERLLPLPTTKDLALSKQDLSAGYSPFYDESTFDENRSIREYFNIVYKRLPVIITLTILATTVVAFYMYRQPSIFQAQTGMIIEPRKAAAGQSRDSININFGNDVNYYNTQLLLLRNRDLMRDVVVQLGLQREPNLFGNQNRGVLATISSMFSSEKSSTEKESSLPTLTDTTTDSINRDQIVLTPEEKERTDRYAGTLLGGLEVDQVEKTNVVNIKVISTKPELAAIVSNTVAKVFIEQDRERGTQGAKKTYDDLTKSIAELKTTIELDQQKLLNLQSSTGLPLMGDKGQELNAGRLQTASNQLLEAKDSRRKIEASYNTALRANANGEIFAVTSGNQAVQEMRKQIADKKAKLESRIQELRTQIQDLNAKKSQLLARYTEEYKDVIAVNEEIKKREDILAKTEKENSSIIELDEKKIKQDVAKEILTGLAAELNAAKIREAQLQQAYDSEIADANQKGVATTRLTTLIREIDTNRGLLDTYSQRQKEQELLISSSSPDNIKITTEATVPSAPIGPNRNRNIIVAFLISLAAGIGLAFLLDYLDDSVKSSDDIGRHLRLPTLALIPHQNLVEKRKLLTGKNGNGTQSTALIALEDNRSAMAEAYRHLRTSLLFSSAGNPPRTILVTSSQPSEGKTTTAINTAITLAQSGAEVVIIDCDLRRPRLHSHFDLENTNGLTNYLSGERNPESLLKPYSNLPNLKIITSGPIPPNPAELLSSNEMKNLLQFLKGNFKHIVIDSPPAISFTDAAILSTLVDGVVLVALAGKSSIHLMRRFKQRLGTIGARIYGVVLNGIKSNSVEYGYYGYGYSKYYSSNDDDSTPLMEEVDEIASIHDTKG
jgi:capsular exopolysaccharide synthesis family protein